MKRINRKEKEYFERIFRLISEDFPKRCGKCGENYADEREYNRGTTEGFTNGLDEFGIIFYRNCKCGSTLDLVLNPAKWKPIDNADFIAYLDRRAHTLIRKGIENDQALNQIVLEFRERYNQYVERRH